MGNPYGYTKDKDREPPNCALCGKKMKEAHTKDGSLWQLLPGVYVCTSCRNIHAPNWNHFDS